MAAAAEVQALLRFLTQDAKVPLATALPKVAALRKGGLISAEAISKASLTDVKSTFADEKLAKQVLSAAKRIVNPKKRGDPDEASPSAKRMKHVQPQDLEAALELPTTQVSEDELNEVTIETNRAPLVLAFAVILLKYTMPEQPLSSRLSLSQAVVSANSQSKARSIGLLKDKTAEEDGWMSGQPRITVLGRKIAVMRRAQYQSEKASEDQQASAKAEQLEQDGKPETNAGSSHSSLWGLDLDALRQSNTPLIAERNAVGNTGLPIHSPQAARNYLLKSFAIVEPSKETSITSEASPMKKKTSATEVIAKREQAAARLFQALDLLYNSWASTLTADELDRRAWAWYVHVRPEISQGQAGWGQRGSVKLSEILGLKRKVG